MKISVSNLLVAGLMLTALTAIAAADDAKDEAIRKDRKQIEGDWRVGTLEVSGEKAKKGGVVRIKVANGKRTKERGVWPSFA